VTAPEAAQGLTWSTMTDAEPLLLTLEHQARQAPRGDFPRAWAALKVMLETVVGWGRRRPPAWLCTSAAYEVAATHLAQALEEPRGRCAA
jgi:hypothetical protein